MRLLALAAATSLALASSGCLALAVPPTVGVAGGALVGGVKNAAGGHVSVAGHALAGGLIGVVFDAVVVVIVVSTVLGDLHHWGD